MAPLPRSPSNAFSLRIKSNTASTPTSSASTKSSSSKDDLRNVVVNLHGQLQELVKERNYYAERSSELENALRVSAPEVLEQAIAVKTLHIADMLLELDDLKEKVQELTSENTTLSREASKTNILFSEIKMLRSQNVRLKKEKAAERSNIEALSSVRAQMDGIRAENNRLRGTINEQRTSLENLRRENEQISSQFKKQRTSAEEMVALRCQVSALKDENGRVRTSLETERKSAGEELADVQSQLASLSEENERLRLWSSQKSAEELANFQSQLESLSEENERLRSQSKLESIEELANTQSTLASLSEENEKLKSLSSQVAEESQEEINELREMVTRLSLDNEMLLAEKESSVNTQSQLDTLTFENDKLRAQRDADQSVLEDLNKAVKSLTADGSIGMLDDGTNSDEKMALKSQVFSLANEVLRLRNEKHAADDAREQEALRSALHEAESEEDEPTQEEEPGTRLSESAFHQTIDNMKSQIEALEDDKQRMANECIESKATIASLEEQIAFKTARLEVLEEMLKANNGGQLPKSLPLKVNLKWATSKIQGGIKAVSSRRNLADSSGQTQEQKDATCIAATTSVRKQLYSPSSKSRPSSPQTAPVADGKVRRMRILVRGEAAIYAGPVSYGMPNGKGSIRFENGSTYLGDVVDGKMHGKGTLYHGSNRGSSSMSRGRFEHDVFLGDASSAASSE